MKTHLALLLIASAAACGGKKDAPAPASGSASASGSGSGTATASGSGTASAPTPPPTQVAGTGTAKVAAGAVDFGCIAWSATKHAAACITGEMAIDGTGERFLEYVGASTPAVKLGDKPLDEATAAAINATLNADGYNPSDATALPLAAGVPYPRGGVEFLWTRTQTNPGGDNQPPTHKNVVTAKCNGKDVELASSEVEGDDPRVEVHGQDDFTLVTIKLHVAREGEQSDHFSAAVIDGKACTAAKSAQ